MPALDVAHQLARVADARVARLATLRADGTPRLVPITFALVDGLVCSLIDEVKPKRSTRLARLDDVRRDPRAALLIDHYDDDWTQLWWVRIDATAAVQTAGDLYDRALAALTARYDAYQGVSGGALLVLTPLRWTGWAA